LFVDAEIVTTPSGHFFRNESAEKVTWLGGLIAKLKGKRTAFNSVFFVGSRKALEIICEQA
jgi:hypothetical protein